jgi:hypothetical protein
MHWLPFTPRKISWYSFLIEAEMTSGAIVWLEGLGQLKNPVTASGIELATFQLVAHCLNQLRYCMSSCPRGLRILK